MVNHEHVHRHRNVLNRLSFYDGEHVDGSSQLPALPCAAMASRCVLPNGHCLVPQYTLKTLSGIAEALPQALLDSLNSCASSSCA